MRSNRAAKEMASVLFLNLELKTFNEKLCVISQKTLTAEFSAKFQILASINFIFMNFM